MHLANNDPAFIRGLKSLLKRRESDCIEIGDHAVERVLATAPYSRRVPPTVNASPTPRLIWLLKDHLCASANKNASVPARKKSYSAALFLLSSIDEAVLRGINQHSESAEEMDCGGTVCSSRDDSPKGIKQSVGLSSSNARQADRDSGKSLSRPSSHNAQPAVIEESFESAPNENPKKTQVPSRSSVTETNPHEKRPSNNAKKGRFLLSGFCKANNAYDDDAGNKNIQNIDAAERRRNSQTVSNNRQPPAYAKKSSNFGADRSSKPQTDAEQAKRKKAALAEEAKKRASAEKAAKEAAARKEEMARQEARKKKAAEEEAKKKAAAEEARKKRAAEEEAKKKRAAEEEARKKRAAEEEARKKRAAEEEEARKKRAAEEETRKKAFEMQKRKQQEQRKRKEAEAERTNLVLQSGLKDCDLRPQRVFVPADPKPTKSGCLYERPVFNVSFTPKALSTEQAHSLASRLDRWDPYWSVCSYVACGVTSRAGKVPLVVEKDTGKTTTAPISFAACSITLQHKDIKDMNNTCWGSPASPEFNTGQKRLIMRMLPVDLNALSGKKGKKRADAHLWPKGSYIVVNKSAATIAQRKQQAHAPEEWKGLSRSLDLTSYISNPTRRNEIKILAYDEQEFFYCIALVEYNSTATLSKKLLTDPLFEHPSVSESVSIAKTHTQTATSIDESDNEEKEEESGRFVFTLTCPFSMTIMQKPVRGKQCSHFQCFDLNSFLSSNSTLHGQQWKCFSCEKFLGFQDLRVCQLTESLINEFKGQIEPSSRDRVEFYADGSYKLLPAKKARGKNKKRGAPVSESSESSKVKKAKVTKQQAEPEIILLD
ncbi:Protein inhibitor of activated STAT [Seminavis robusta]|uniref:Protein inhibitor of activated STAT n=1 Tax=Seminavis robusta TaxID=568900 RepID=A0A9N8ES48_9STRA|nr:Protein inhibitor of activated STAT [Seminavis robusta]|eukprot:Sro1721_g293530.1 Protein inhibitor of activated STAT (827) ;mRNA; r:8415-11305